MRYLKEIHKRQCGGQYRRYTKSRTLGGICSTNIKGSLRARQFHDMFRDYRQQPFRSKNVGKVGRLLNF